ncbi:MAG: HD domain-containing protein [Chloroflexi bacterium]|nr:MAG: HD domain-containing protein [Chloroflexota bacterium]TME54867.1 MAG: HD domain-containing protein [Chloroflexota bacterium]
MAEQLRLAELMAALSLATDLGMGQPLEQALRTCLIAVALGERLGLENEELSEVYYVALLRFLGCTADAHEFAAMVGGDDIAIRAAIAPVLGGTQREFASQVMPEVGKGHGPLRRARLLAGMLSGGQRHAREGVRAGCELAENLAARIGLAPNVRRGLRSALETWNGTGFPDGAGGEDIPLSSRVVFVARDAEVLHRLGGSDRVKATLRARSGVTYDPAIASTFLHYFAEVLAAAETASPWAAVLACEPEPHPWVPETRLDATLEAFADFVDVKSPFTAGHSRGVAMLAAAAWSTDPATIRRAGLIHDLGRVSVPNGIWDKPSPLTEGEWERVRLHPYHSERILLRVARLEPLAALAGAHHERVDGSGYHRGSKRPELTPQARVLAAADAYQAMTQPRPHRPAFTRETAADALRADARAGLLDINAVDDVLTAAGHQARRVHHSWPAGLSDREVEVLRLICRGGTKKQAAELLRISPATVDHHVRHIYDKVGVATRAGATLFAIKNDLLQ